MKADVMALSCLDILSSFSALLPVYYKILVQRGSHKNRREISKIRVSGPPDLY